MVMSVPPPVPNGTTTRIGLSFGHAASWARARRGAVRSAAAVASSARRVGAGGTRRIGPVFPRPAAPAMAGRIDPRRDLRQDQAVSVLSDEPIVVWGAGAIGGTIGAVLRHAGHPVRFVDIVPEHVAAIR